MLLQKLGEYADERLPTTPAMYQHQPIAWLIDLDLDGRCWRVVPTADLTSAATKRGNRYWAPHLKRANGIRPKLLADTGVYALGLATPEAKLERVRQQHEAFVVLVDACARATRLPEVEAVARFLEGLDAAVLPLPEDFDPGATLTFRVDGVFPIDLPEVREFWAMAQGANAGPDGTEGGDGAEGEAAEVGARMPCIVCGKVKPVLLRHPLKIKGIPGGQMSGTDLISANAKAYESYGLSNSLIAPTCQGCAEKYGNALNALLAGEATHLRVGGMAYAYWTAQATGFNPGSLFSAPDPTEVRELVDSARTGRRAATEIDAVAFYATTLGASGGRAVVRDWIDTTVGEAKRRLGRYFALQALVDGYGGAWQPLAIWRLANATVRDARKEAPPASVASALLGLALGGRALPLDLLFQAVRRNRAEGEVSRERATLIKMVLGSQPGVTDEEGEAMTQLDLSNTDPAYLCGRLLAILDAIQRRALGTTNATVIDRYYGTASSAPAAVFGTLLHGAQPHLAKMRKDPRSQPAQRALERRLEEVMAPLDRFPATLTLPQQGLFALGYYHQRAEDRRAATERKEAREAGQAAPTADAAIRPEEPIGPDDGAPMDEA